MRDALKLMVRTTVAAGWAPLAVLILHELAGSHFGHEPYVDPVAHFSGGVAIAFFVRSACARDRGLLGRPSGLASDLIAFGLTVFVAMFWEIGEFGSDVFRGTRIQQDTGNMVRDLILGTLGGGVLLLAARFTGWFRRLPEAR